MQPILPPLLIEIALGLVPIVAEFAVTAPAIVAVVLERSPVAETSPVTVAPPLKVVVPVTAKF